MQAQPSKSKISLGNLPYNINTQILGFLSPENAMRMRGVNQHFNNYFKDPNDSYFVTERRNILASRTDNDDTKIDKLISLYKKAGPYLNQATIAEERKAILNSTLPYQKEIILYNLYSAGKDKLSEAVIVQEVKGILNSTMSSEDKKYLLSCLYSAGKDKFSEAGIVQERMKILNSGLDDYDKAAVLVKLYTLSGARFLLQKDFRDREMKAIRDSGMENEYIQIALSSFVNPYGQARALWPQSVRIPSRSDSRCCSLK
jgi:hypothetical protein